MSTTPESEFNLEELFLPSWAKDSTANKYAKHSGDDRSSRDDRRGGGGARPPRRDFGSQRPGEQRGGQTNRGPGGPRSGQSRDGHRPSHGGGDRFRRDEPQREWRPP